MSILIFHCSVLSSKLFRESTWHLVDQWIDETACLPACLPVSSYRFYGLTFVLLVYLYYCTFLHNSSATLSSLSRYHVMASEGRIDWRQLLFTYFIHYHKPIIYSACPNILIHFARDSRGNYVVGLLKLLLRIVRSCRLWTENLRGHTRRV